MPPRGTYSPRDLAALARRSVAVAAQARQMGLGTPYRQIQSLDSLSILADGCAHAETTGQTRPLAGRAQRALDQTNQQRTKELMNAPVFMGANVTAANCLYKPPSVPDSTRRACREPPVCNRRHTFFYQTICCIRLAVGVCNWRQPRDNKERDVYASVWRHGTRGIHNFVGFHRHFYRRYRRFDRGMSSASKK